jgi:hypothetical protein
VRSKIPGSLMTFLGPGTNITSKIQIDGREKHSQDKRNHLETCQEMTNKTTTQSDTN